MKDFAVNAMWKLKLLQRITKGDAFRLKYDAYKTRQEEVHRQLTDDFSTMTKQELIEKYELWIY